MMQYASRRRLPLHAFFSTTSNVPLALVRFVEREVIMGIRVLDIRCRSLPGVERWRDALTDIYCAFDVIPDRQPFHARIVERRIGSLSLTRFSCDDCTLIRSTPHIGQDGVAGFSVSIPVSGRMVHCHGDRSGCIRPGEALVTDLSRPYGFRCIDGLASVCVKIPANAALSGGSFAIAPAVTDGRRAADPALLKGVTAMIEALLQTPQPVDQRRAGHAAGRLLDLIALMFAAPPDETPPTPGLAALRRRAEALIQAEGTDPGLTPQTVAERLGVSRGYLHRAMRGSGHTLQGLIRETRIAAGINMLMDPEKSDLTIARIAYDAGFASHASFTDAVRRRHGRTPREVRDQALRRDDDG